LNKPAPINIGGPAFSVIQDRMAHSVTEWTIPGDARSKGVIEAM